MRDRLYYQNLPVQKIREFGMGKNLKAEITIVVPRKELTEEIVEQEPVIDNEQVLKNTSEDITADEIVIEKKKNEELIKVKNVYAIGKDAEIFLGVRGSDEFEELCKFNKLNPIQIDSALKGNIKTHKGFSYEIK